MCVKLSADKCAELKKILVMLINCIGSMNRNVRTYIIGKKSSNVIRKTQMK